MCFGKPTRCARPLPSRREGASESHRISVLQDKKIRTHTNIAVKAFDDADVKVPFPSHTCDEMNPGE